jgi:hypothetical protein
MPTLFSGGFCAVAEVEDARVFESGVVAASAVEAEAVDAGFAELGLLGEAAFAWGLFELPDCPVWVCSAELLNSRLPARSGLAVSAAAITSVRRRLFSLRLIVLLLADMNAYRNRGLVECGHDGEESR